MVLKAVSFVCFLWIGAISALTSNNEDGFTATLERRFQTPNVDSLAGDHVPRFRKSALNSFPSFRQETAESQHFDQESKGFAVPAGRPANFPNFASIGGLRELQEGSEVASGSFNHEFKIPKVHIPDISVPQPLFRESFNFRKKNDTTDTKPISSNGTNKTDSKIQERSVKKELNLKANLDDQLIEESAQIPFHRIFGRKDANPESYITHTRVPRQYIHYPVFDRRDPLFDRRERAESINSPFARENIFLNPRHFQQFEEEKAVNQRFFPNFPDGRFFGPAPLPQQAVQVGRVGHRGSHNQFSKQKPFRGSPEAFASHNSFNDFEPVDNSILGSGNFEVIKGGTFYDEDDPHLNHNPYDPYLDNSYVVFPTGNPPNSNHVDDFFQNFRDFSEFATRRSGSENFDESPNDGYIASGFSENIPSISRAGDMMTSESKPGSIDNSTKGYEIIQTIKMQNNTKSINDSSSEFPNENIEKSTFLNPKQLKKHLYKIGKDNKTKSKKTIKISQERKRPKNIQEVLEQMDQSSQLSTSDDLEVDPLIAIF